MGTGGGKELRVNDVMTRDPAFVHPWDTVREVARVLDANEISGLPVVDESGRVVGVVSRTDVLHLAVQGPLGSRPLSAFERLAEGLTAGTGLDPDEFGTVDEFMSTDLVCATPDDSIGSVARRMAEAGVHRVIVTSPKDGLVGIVTALDLLRVFPSVD